MYRMSHDIVIGGQRLRLLEKVVIKRSVENLADTATITLPAYVLGRPIELSDKIHEGDGVNIGLGYDGETKLEFSGYVKAIGISDSGIVLDCEDDIYLTRKPVADKEYKKTTLKNLLQDVAGQVGISEVSCDYDFTYDKFVTHGATAYEVLKKVKEECGAHIFVMDGVLHVHAPYAYMSGKAAYSMQRNIEREGMQLEYRSAEQRKAKIIVKGKDAAGKTITAEAGSDGGDQVTLTLPGVSTQATLQSRADAMLETKSYTGYSGSFQSWLLPVCRPCMEAEVRDSDHQERDGRYYVLAVETTYSKSGGQRRVSIGKKTADL